MPTRPLPPNPPASIAHAPQPWLRRKAGECAFPVGGAGWTVQACCNPCGARAYCPAHLQLMRGPPAPTADQIERALRPFIG
ncbi:MAG TPA: hypothetical protein VII73_10895 [Caulobacteraceae bacterium]